MMGQPIIRRAGLREEGVPCPSCEIDIGRGDDVVFCDECRSVHHGHCWETNGGCGQFDCDKALVPLSSAGDTIRISARDLETAQPLPPSRPPAMGPRVAISVGPDPESLRVNRMAVASFAIALISLPLYGIVTGLLAVAVGALSLVGRNSFRRKGLPFAAAGILLGICSFTGWAVYYSAVGDGGRVAMVLDEFEPDPEALDNLPPAINQAMKANVLIKTGTMWREGLGSGVILKIENGEALIVTNRHVIDAEFADGGGSAIEDLSGIMVKAIGQAQTAADVIWLGPGAS